MSSCVRATGPAARACTIFIPSTLHASDHICHVSCVHTTRQGQQRERQRSNLHFADKLMYMFGQLVFGSQGARLGTFLYLVVMHLLVVGSLMRMTHHSSSQLYEHQQIILDGRHDVTALMHHEAPADMGGGAPDSRLP